MEATAKKSFFLQSLKVGVFALIFSCVGVLILALIAKLCNIPDNVLPIVNQILKAVAVAIAVLVGVKQDKFLLKGLLGAAIYWVLSFVLFSILGGAFHWGQIFLDLAVALVVSALISFIKSRRA